jgi:mannose/fructose/N-acetylgalactosamine-specific phosphotransferase system component IIB
MVLQPRRDQLSGVGYDKNANKMCRKELLNKIHKIANQSFRELLFQRFQYLWHLVNVSNNLTRCIPGEMPKKRSKHNIGKRNNLKERELDTQS